MTNQQPIRTREDDSAALNATLFGEDAPKLLNIKCFVSGDLTTTAAVSAAAENMIRNRRDKQAVCSKRFEEKHRERRNAVQFIASSL